MELNREQIVKALECCRLDNEHQEEECDKCPFNECPQTICQNLLAYHALALIHELTEENERLRVVADMSDTTLTDALRIVNEFCDSRIKRAKADTVNKMYIEIKERCIKGGIYPAFVARTISEVAKELLEEGK